MAMPPGNVVISEKMQFPSGGAGVNGFNSGEINQHYRQWFVDERDGFIGWLRSEFAAANAIIDSLCHHLRVVSEPGEYDMVIAAIQQRRCNWNQVLHMQQFFPVADVGYALQQVQWRRQHRYMESVKAGGKEFKRSGAGFKQGYRAEVFNGGNNLNAELHSDVKNPDLDDKAADSKSKISAEKTSVQTDDKNDNGSYSLQSEDNKQSRHSYTGRTFVGMETIEGKEVNAVEGLISYSDFLNEAEVAKVLSLMNDMRDAGRKGQLQGQTFVLSKRPAKGHGREMIQLGFPLADPPLEDENLAGLTRDKKVESIPGFIQDIIDRLVATQITTEKPDACIFNVYNEGDFSQPYNCPPWFGRPISVLFLTECDMTFGKLITSSDYSGDFRGSLKLSLTPGSLLLMQGMSSDVAKYAIPSIRKQRVLITFTKFQPRKVGQNDGLRHHPSSMSSHWGPPPSRSPSHMRHQGPKNYGAAPPTIGVLAAPPVRSQLPPPNVMQPLFAPAPVAQAIPFPPLVPLPPGPSAWPAPPPRHPSPHLPLPGTGVFLPPGSGNPSLVDPASRQIPAMTPEVNSTMQTARTPDNSIAPSKDGWISNTSSKGEPDEKIPQKGCNGSIGHDTNGIKVAKDEEKSLDKVKVGNGD